MPVLHDNSYIPPKILFEGHLQTIYPALFRKITNLPSFEQIRITTPDEDFIDLDFYQQDSEKLVIISHGLEGSSDRPYVKGAIKSAFKSGFNVVAWNFRGCSGEMNKNARFYHSGATEDLETVIRWALSLGSYKEVVLVGYSLGGNLTLKYLGENNTTKFAPVTKSIVFSVPLNLRAGSLHIGKRSNYLYSKRFLKSLIKKVKEKDKTHPMNIHALKNAKTLYDFDNYLTAPLHGFNDANDYYEKCSAINYIKGISIKTHVINAENDPLVPIASIDLNPFISNPNVTLVLTEQGGHVGYPSLSRDFPYWSEKKLMELLS